ncbi:MAG: two-component system response regulator [Betaproteobacteria bacterium HGW-Betaproteobacteria-10]|nr:MAG: two-component system response regulator [Betaproteobacteria bacterium HGW-Betaproteobacteria-10]
MNVASGIAALTRISKISDDRHILIVDDEPRYRSAYRELLAGPGRIIEECGTGKEAILRLSQRDIDVVVLDLKLPDIDGAEIMAWLTRNRISTSIVVFSANQSIDSAIHALRQGAFEFIRKHSDPNDLIQSVDRALRRQKLEREHAVMTARLEQSERLHRFLVEQSPDLIYTLDEQGCFIFVNNRVESLLGYRREELIRQHYSLIVHEDDIEQARYAFNERRIGERATSNFEVRLINKQNGVQHFDNRQVTAILSSQGIYTQENDLEQKNFLGTTGFARDITERKRAEETINFQAFHDLLTGLPNRTLFMDRLELALPQAKRRNQRVGVMFLDLDRFKLINDSYGHLEGDRLLQDFAQRTRHCLRSGDTLARQGGDEFTVLLPDITHADDVTLIAQKILAELKTPFTVADKDFIATVSIGIAIYPEDGESSEDLIRNADLAMYQTKSQGKNGYLEFTSAMNTSHIERLSLENDLREALKQGNQFELHYQPQISLSKRCVVGLEALIRWNHPTQGLISPDAFIPLAEETGLVVAISDWVLQTGCAQLAKLRGMGFTSLRLGINLSPKEFERADLFERIATPLSTHALPAEFLEIEITESLLMKDAEAIIAKVRQLRRAGVRISIDDFGTRFSSLNYLRRFSVNGIKIDQSFIRDLGATHGSGGIVHAIMGLARSFGLDVLAEGVENSTQLNVLAGLGCDEMQGFHFSRPLPVDQLEAFLTNGLKL